MTERIAGLRGRLPIKPVGERYAIRWLHEYAAAPVPAYPIDVSKGITDFGMLGNDVFGDCGVAAYEHDRMLAGATPTTAETVGLYQTYDHGQDVGVNLADFLLYLFHNGEIEGFAPVELGTVDAVMGQLGRGVILGVNLTDDANALFNAGQPWTVANGEQPDPAEGHAILKVGQQQPTGANGYGTVVTWGALQEADWTWEQACVEEAWAIVTKDDMGDVAFAALLADLQALPHATVTPTPAPGPVTPPAPAPQPAPSPTPGPSPLDRFRAEVARIVRDAEEGIVAAAEDVIQAVGL